VGNGHGFNPTPVALGVNLVLLLAALMHDGAMVFKMDL